MDRSVCDQIAQRKIRINWGISEQCRPYDFIARQKGLEERLHILVSGSMPILDSLFSIGGNPAARFIENQANCFSRDSGKPGKIPRKQDCAKICNVPVTGINFANEIFRLECREELPFSTRMRQFMKAQIGQPIEKGQDFFRTPVPQGGLTFERI